MTSADPLAVAAIVARILDHLGIPYIIGGPVASSFYGEPRSTLDLDIMVDLNESQARRLAESLGDAFYVNADAAASAAAHRRTFNAIHYESTLKVDFFVSEREPFAREQFGRRRFIRVGATSHPLALYAPEDLVIRKLLWFRAGGEVSERQWRDIVGILKTSSSNLDYSLMSRVAGDVHVDDLLERAIGEVGNE